MTINNLTLKKEDCKVSNPDSRFMIITSKVDLEAELNKEDAYIVDEIGQHLSVWDWEDASIPNSDVYIYVVFYRNMGFDYDGN